VNGEVKAREVVSKVRDMADRPFVITVTHQYAADWDELAMFVLVDDEAKDREVARLCNALLEYLNEVLPKGNPHFTWQVQFKRHSQVIEVIFPGDAMRKVSSLRYPR
jgi:hypothetical protein